VGALADEPQSVGVPAAAPSVARSVLPAGSPVYVVLQQDLSTATAEIGQRFEVAVAQDVVAEGTVVIPAGAEGWGEVTFVTNRGGFGKPGILGITLRELELGDRAVKLDGRYREEGTSRNAESAATYFVVGVFAGLIRGGKGGIPAGRELKARTGEAIAFVVGAEPPPVPPRGEPGPEDQPASALNS